MQQTEDMIALGKEYQPFEKHLKDPFPFYERARREGSIFFSPLVNAWVVSRYDDVKTILSQPDIFSSKDTLLPPAEFPPSVFAELAQGYPQTAIMINSDGRNHSRFRDPALLALSPDRLKTLASFIRTRANTLIDDFIADGEADIVSSFTYPLPIEVMLSLFNIPQERKAQCKKWSSDLAALFSMPLAEARQVEYARSFVQFQQYMAQLIAEHRAHPQEDFVSIMITTKLPGEEPLSDLELINVLTGILLAGHETSTNVLGNGLAFFLKHQEIWKQLCEHPEYIPKAYEEILRYDAPSQGILRTTTRKVVIGNVEIPSNTLVLLLLGSANRDETHFHSANEFQIDRKPNPHVAFGHGVHKCIGFPLARLQGRIAFEVLTRRLPDLRLAPNQDLIPLPGLAFRGFPQLYVQWTPGKV